MSDLIPKTLSAAILVSPKKKLKLRHDILIPKLQSGQVLVKIFYSGLCQSQIKEIEGERGKDNYLPHMLGHEATGKVILIGKKVKKVNVGDEVILSWIKSEGMDSGGIKYKTINGEIINAGPVTTFSNFSIISENRLTKLPKDLDNLKGVLFGCAIPTGAGLVFNQTMIKSFSSLAIIGLGGVGLSALIAAKTFKPKKIIVIDIEEKKLNLAKKFGATHTINSNKRNVLKEIYKLNDGFGVDYAIESAGFSSTIELGMEILNKKGSLIFASHPRHGEKIKINPHDLISGKKLNGTWGGNCNPDKDFNKIAKIFSKNKVSFKYFLKDQYDFKNINNAINDLKNRKIVRGIIKMRHDEYR